jgi:hypothetical protein
MIKTLYSVCQKTAATKTDVILLDTSKNEWILALRGGFEGGTSNETRFLEISTDERGMEQRLG